MVEYIEKEAAQKIICGWCGVCKSPTVCDLMHCDDICPQFAQIPAADVRPVVHGKWVPVGADDLDEGMFMCSECGSEHFFPELLLNIPADNFCPNCGADMRPEQPKE